MNRKQAFIKKKKNGFLIVFDFNNIFLHPPQFDFREHEFIIRILSVNYILLYYRHTHSYLIYYLNTDKHVTCNHRLCIDRLLANVLQFW